MAYFTKEFTRFFKELEENNHKEWFHANKKRYEAEVKKPFYRLIEDVVKRAQKIDPAINLEPKDAVFRINRDIRFSKDKTPYKTNVSAVVSRGGRKNTTEPGIFFSLSANEIQIGGGCHAPEKDRLYNIRKKIMDNPKAVEKILNEKKFKDTYGEIQGKKNKILPKEFKEAAASNSLLANRSFHIMTSYKANNHIESDDLDKFIFDHLKIAGKWNEWLSEAQNA